MKFQNKYLFPLVLFFVVGCSLYGGYYLYRKIPDGLVQVNGRIEGNEISISSKLAGKIQTMNFHEGDNVHSGDVMATFDNRLAKAKLDQAKASLDKAEAVLKLSSKDSKRFNSLAKEGAIDLHKGEQATVEYKVSEANSALAKGLVDEAQSIFDDMSIAAPKAGTIMEKIREVGEVVPAGAPLYTLIDLDNLYLKVYVPENLIGKVKLGLKAQVYVDAFPNTPFLATVKAIASSAEFTPKEVQTKDERVKLVYAVKLYIDDNHEHKLTPGMPADAMIQIDPNVNFKKPVW